MIRPLLRRILSSRSALFVAGMCGLFLGFVIFANLHIARANRDLLYTSIDDVPARETGLLLGASSTLRDGRPNPFFTNRMDAAAALYQVGKVRRLLVSGDNSRTGYDEPTMMKDALIKRGVPAAAIACDYAGIHTLDSVIRARTVFGLQRCTIITQRFHNARALEMARVNGLDAIGFCAPDVSLRYSIRTGLREIASRTVAMLDLYVWHTQPRFPGPREPLPPLSS